jgi:hypothetical protein
MRTLRFATIVGSLLLCLLLWPAAARADDFLAVVSAKKCDSLDIPDAPLRAFRSPNGSITAFATHYRNRALVGESFSALVQKCSAVYEGALDPDPSHFDYKTWIAATWLAEDGIVYALGHNEYQAHEVPGQCRFIDYASCWYNSIVLLRSDDLGETFHRVDAKKEALLAPGFTDAMGQGHPRGYTSPTNLVRWADYLYSLVGYSGADKGDIGRCLIRTQLPISAASWSILTADGFVPLRGSPYSGGGNLRCAYVSGIHGFVGSISRLVSSSLFVATVAEDGADGGSIVAYFSDDLVRWRDRQVLTKVSLFWSTSCQNDRRYTYPSLIDESSTSRNFDEIGLTATLYLVQSGCRVGTDRNLVKAEVHITPR